MLDSQTLDQHEVLGKCRALLSQFRALVGATVTDETLLTYLVKNKGDIVAATQHFHRGPWSGLLKTLDKGHDEKVTTSNVIEQLTPTDQRGANKIRCLGHAARDAKGGPTQKQRFFSVNPLVNHTPWLGVAIVDIMSSCRMNFEEDVLADKPFLSVFFSFMPSTQRVTTRKHKPSAFSKSAAIAQPPTRELSTELNPVKETLGSQVCVGPRYLGALPSSVATTLGILVYFDFIRITARLAEPLPAAIQIGTPVPLLLNVYLTSKALDPQVPRVHHDQTVLRNCWMQLLFSILRLTPHRPSLLWSFGPLPLERAQSADGVFDWDASDNGLKEQSNVRHEDQKEVETFDQKSDATENPDEDEDTGERLVENFEKEQTLYEECEEANARTNEVLGECSGEADLETDVPLHPAVFRSVLRPYQLQGVRWMLEHETLSIATEEFSQNDVSNDGEATLHPMWDEFVIAQPTDEAGVVNLPSETRLVFYFSRSTGTLTKEFPANVRQCLGGVLADEMGLGKTVQTIALLSCEWNPSQQEIDAFRMAWEAQKADLDEHSAEFTAFLVARRQQSSAIKRHVRLHSVITANVEEPSVNASFKNECPKTQLLGGTLIILPLSLLSQWKQELLTHITPGVCLITEFYGRSRPKDPISLTEVDVVLTTYGMVTYEFCRINKREKASTSFGASTSKKEDSKTAKQWRCEALAMSPLWLVQWRRIVLDEAHIIKSHVSKVSQAVSSLPAKFRWCLTGTPIQNSVDDVFPLLRFLRVDPWGSWAWWCKAVAQRIQNNQTTEAIRAVRRMLHPLMLRRTKRSCDANGKPILLLPPKTEHIVRLTLNVEERQFYTAVYKRITTKLDELVQSGNAAKQTTHVLELLLRLRQAACHPLLIYSASSTRVLRSLDNISELVSRFLRGTGGAVREVFVRQQLEQLRDVNGAVADCPICCEPPTDAVMVPCCHIMCRGCALTALQQAQAASSLPAAATEYPCPVCRHPFTKVTLLALPGAARLPQRIIDCLFDDEGQFHYSSKLKSLHQYLQKDNAECRRSVVFSQWTSLLDIVEVLLDHVKLPHRRLDGSLSLQQREDVLAWFRAPPNPDNKKMPKCSGGVSERGSDGRILLASLRAGGVGLNLTVATRCYILDPWWNPAVESQAIQRIHRLGQTEAVEVFRLIVEQTVEERILQLQEAKDAHASGALQQSPANAGLPSPHNSKLKLCDLLELFKEFSS